MGQQVTRDANKLQGALDEIQAMKMSIDSMVNRCKMMFESGSTKLYKIQELHDDLLHLNQRLLQIVPVLTGQSLPQRQAEGRAKRLVLFTKGEEGTSKFFSDKTYTYDNHKGYTTSGKVKVTGSKVFISDDSTPDSFAPINGETAEKLARIFRDQNND